jgi:hypothetical protein
MTSNDWASHFDDFRHTLTEHHHNLLFAVPQAVNHGSFHPSSFIAFFLLRSRSHAVMVAAAAVVEKRHMAGCDSLG